MFKGGRNCFDLIMQVLMRVLVVGCFTQLFYCYVACLFNGIHFLCCNWLCLSRQFDQ